MRKVLIPSSSGQGFKVQNHHETSTRSTVLIPSSSGQGFKPLWGFMPFPAGLNPFFIRARFQRALFSIVQGFCVLIPSSSGQGFKDARGEQDQLNRCLNPFFIRARFQRPRGRRIHPRRAVLIPSSSGQGFKDSDRRNQPPPGHVLIPSSSGQGFKAARRG